METTMEMMIASDATRYYRTLPAESYSELTLLCSRAITGTRHIGTINIVPTATMATT